MVRKEIHRPDYSDTLLLEAVCRALLQGETTAKKMAVSNLETASVPNGNKWRDKDYLTPTQAADLLGIGRMSIYRYIRNGKIKVVRFQRKTLISKADIQAMFDFLTPKETELPGNR